MVRIRGPDLENVMARKKSNWPTMAAKILRANAAMHEVANVLDSLRK